MLTSLVVKLRILTDSGTEYCGKVEQHDYQLYLAINDIDHTKTKGLSCKVKFRSKKDLTALFQAA
jgi:hypothetical protein